MDRAAATNGSLPPDILDQMHDGVYLVDTDRRIRFWNRGAERVSGYAAADVIGTRCSDNLLMHTNEQGNPLCAAGCPLAATMRDGDACEIGVFLRHKDGHRVPVHVRAAPLRDESGRMIGAIEVFNDDSARSALREEIDELKALALFDPLTEVGNRRFAEMTLTARHDEQQRYGWRYGPLMIDIDHFKSFNDRFGHATGDRVLRMVAQTLAANVRSFDVVARWGGEEFIAILEKVDPDDLARRADMLRRLVGASALQAEGEQLSVTISIGGVVSGDAEEAGETIKRADVLLYRSKEAGRDRVTCG
jgi:diguanylate cyclase (GGDEF)-like protein/PAS domain S-box-containing protein